MSRSRLSASHLKDKLLPRGRGMGDEDMRADDAYLSYHDICLMKEDIDCLRDDWLTDNNIAFWEEYLEHEVFPMYPENKIFLLRPSMVFLIMNTADPLTLVSALPPIKSSGATHVFLPINNNRDVTMAEGGSHWSLLVIGVNDHVGFHYDSMDSANLPYAIRVCDKMSIILDSKLNFYDVHDTPQQDNSSDCGVHVCLTMRHLLTKRLLNAGTGSKVKMGLEGKRWDCVDGRREMLGIIRGLRRAAERSRSPAMNGKDGSPPRIE